MAGNLPPELVSEYLASASYPLDKSSNLWYIFSENY